MIKVNNVEGAWEIIHAIFPGTYKEDKEASKGAGYPIYRDTAEDGYYNYICDLGNRFEVNIAEGNRTVNICVDDEGSWAKAKAEAIKQTKVAIEYGDHMLREYEEGGIEPPRFLLMEQLKLQRDLIDLLEADYES